MEYKAYGKEEDMGVVAFHTHHGGQQRVKLDLFKDPKVNFIKIE